MNLSTIELTGVRINLFEPLHIGSGYARGPVNRTVVRGRDGLVYVPGSALKGKARDACASLAGLYLSETCRVPHPQAMTKDDHHTTCVICRIFGAPGQPSSLRWHAAQLSQDWQEALRPTRKEHAVFGQTTTRTQVQLSRTRGMATEAHLFTSELAIEGLTFIAEPLVTGRLSLTPSTLSNEPDVYYELILLLSGLKLIATLGGGASRGTGRCEVDLSLAVLKVNGRELPVATQLAHAEELQMWALEAQS
jgi:CRISPR/Cas system CSM-associated protein Csm3 (group 7 of RAMP superfamily)